MRLLECRRGVGAAVSAGRDLSDCTLAIAKAAAGAVRRRDPWIDMAARLLPLLLLLTPPAAGSL
eukprot:2124852-Prymnesium_polylepis.1